MQKECVSCFEIKDSREFRKWRRKCRRCEGALKAPWQGQTAYAREWMRKKRETEPSYGRSPWRALRHTLKSLNKHPEQMLCKHALVVCPDAHPSFRDPIDPNPNPCEAMMLAEEAA